MTKFILVAIIGIHALKQFKMYSFETVCMCVIFLMVIILKGLLICNIGGRCRIVMQPLC